MKKYLERLKIEINEVKAKHEKLDDYLNEIKESGTTLNEIQVSNLKEQHYYMLEYIEILEERYIYDTELEGKKYNV
jgi:uncharacterized protein YdcH (DUF465 family)